MLPLKDAATSVGPVVFMSYSAICRREALKIAGQFRKAAFAIRLLVVVAHSKFWATLALVESRHLTDPGECS